jgi:hypothetical protein
MALLASGCGYKGAVSRIEPDSARSRAETRALKAEEAARVEAGLTPPATSRPQRVDDLQLKLGVRPPDPFALPPEGSRVQAAPFPGEPPATTETPQS